MVIGLDPAKHSQAMAVPDSSERQLASLQVSNDNDGYRASCAWLAVGRGGSGRSRARIFHTGHGRKNDPTDARTIAVVGLRTSGLRMVQPDGDAVALRLMSERRRELVHTRTQTVNRLHQLLMELIPAGAARDLTAAKARHCWPQCARGTWLAAPAGSSRPISSTTSPGSTATATYDGSPGGTTTPPTQAPLRWRYPAETSNGTGCRAQATAGSTTRCTLPPLLTSDTTTRAPSTTPASSPPARAKKARCAA